jgi:hypothetical protein
MLFLFPKKNNRSSEISGIFSFTTGLNFQGDDKREVFSADYFNKHHSISVSNSENKVVSGYLLNGRLSQPIKKSLLKIYEICGSVLSFTDENILKAFLNQNFNFRGQGLVPGPLLNIRGYEELAQFLNQFNRELIEDIKQDIY